MDTYPTRDEHTKRWEQLARDIVASQSHRCANAPSSGAAPKGTLIVIGSGIEGVNFAMGAEEYLRTADKVFFCVSNPPTRVWLHTLRPDAYDLYVLYDDTKPRPHTYVQWSEAVLHYVRKGMRVVMVFYGHPGMFVFSSHRAIAIARREGHYAIMKPGISALDCLCADLGVDPAYPGMETFEATDLLLRNRRLDTTTHVVLWQVGLVGDIGYRRKGYINDKFPLLVDYLNKFYGPDHTITHYIAARHPTFEPTIAAHKIEHLLNHRVQATLRANSTFYIPPKDEAPMDIAMAVRLGLIESGETGTVPLAVRRNDSYTTVELAAIEEFDHFRVSDEYQFQSRTRAAEFLIELGRNVPLQDLYRDAPAQAVSEDTFPGLSVLERHLLMQRKEFRAQLAAKGAVVISAPDERFVIDIHDRRTLASEFRAALAALYRSEHAEAALDSWISSRGYKATLARLSIANRLVSASMLLPWTGVYSTADGSVLTVVGDPDFNRSSLVFYDQVPITGFTFHNSTLTWLATEGNPCSGELTFRVPNGNGLDTFARTISGKVWAANGDEPVTPNFFAEEVVAAVTPLSVWAGRYITRITQDGLRWDSGPIIDVVVPRPVPGANLARLFIDGHPVEGVRIGHRCIQWGNDQITFSRDMQIPGKHLLSGRLKGFSVAGLSAADHHEPFEGKYRTFFWSANQWKPYAELHYDGLVVRLNGKTYEQVVFDHDRLQWASTDEDLTRGRVQFFIDPATQLPKFIGYLWTSESCPDEPNVFGMLSLESTAQLRLSPSFEDSAVPAHIWEKLAAIAMSSSEPSFHLLWSRWQRTRFACGLLNDLVPAIYDVLKRTANTNEQGEKQP